MQVSRTTFFLAVSVLVLAITSIVQARYLPTRSDDARREQIKEVLRALLELAPEERLFGRLSYPYADYRDEGHLAKRSVGANNNAVESFRHHDDQMTF